jgi:hypothetical protein
VIVEVTQADIDRGVPGDACGCPVALAATRATGKLVSVGPVTIRYAHNMHRVKLPAAAERFIHNFDLHPEQGRVVPNPFTFEIDLPEGDTP